MDYVLGSVAALVTGNVTPSRPRTLKRALTPTKHQPSPNVTPKSEFVDDRSIFLSPSMQKKKAIVKKSPKRIFQNPDLETTEDGEGNLSLTSPKADKVKKHLKDDLDIDVRCNTSATEPKTPKIKSINQKEMISSEESVFRVNEEHSNVNTPKKKKRKSKSVSEYTEIPAPDIVESAVVQETTGVVKSPKKTKPRRKSVNDHEDDKENANNEIQNDFTSSRNDKSTTEQKDKSSNSDSIKANKEEVIQNVSNASPKKKNKKRKKKSKQQTGETKLEVTNEKNEDKNQTTTKKKNRKRKKSKSQQSKPEAVESDLAIEDEEDEKSNIPTKKSKIIVNPNAITDMESDSEHESDDEIESENEEINKKVFDSEPVVNESSDEDEDEEKATKDKDKDEPQKEKVEKKKGANKKGEINLEDDIKRTLFVGNVPFSAKCKKEVKKIFNKHGQIDTIRIRTVPVKDGRYTPKLAVIKNELHPERTTVNVYIKYADEESVEKALAENNTVLNENHLRVSRSSHTGAEHDPKSSIFVGNLPFAMEDEALRQKFENCGEIESVRIIRDKKTNAGKGFGYVNFATKDGVELALELTEEDLTIKNRIIRVKRCTQSTDKKKQTSDKGGFKKPFSQRPSPGNQRVQNADRQNQGGPRGNQGGPRGNQGGPRGNQGGPRGNQGGPRGNQGGPRGNQGGPRGNQGGPRGYQGVQRGNQGGPRGNLGNPRWNQGGQRQGTKDEAGRDGAHRRVMQKRKSQDVGGGDGPANKRPKNINQPHKEKNVDQPNKEKKTKKEFVGMTAEKKKKRKFDKGQKKKKALSEILTKL